MYLRRGGGTMKWHYNKTSTRLMRSCCSCFRVCVLQTNQTQTGVVACTIYIRICDKTLPDVCGVRCVSNTPVRFTQVHNITSPVRALRVCHALETCVRYNIVVAQFPSISRLAQSSTSSNTQKWFLVYICAQLHYECAPLSHRTNIARHMRRIKMYE